MPELQLLGPDLTHLLRQAELQAVGFVRRTRRRFRSAEVRAESIELHSTCGYRLAATIWRPAGGEAVLPAVVWVGDGAGGRAAAEDPHAPLVASDAAAMGMVVMALDLAGRGDSTGEDDHGGPEHADNVACAVRLLTARSDVDPQRVGLVGLGLGAPVCVAAAAAGAPVAWVLDWEGPVDRETLLSLHPDAPLGVDDAVWWSDRDTTGQLAGLPCGYVRLQSEDDHHNPEELRHAQRALAAMRGRGSLPPGAWFQINDHPRGEHPARPQWLPPGRFSAGRAIRRKLARLASDRRSVDAG